MTDNDDLRIQFAYAKGYKKGYEDALDSFSQWLKKQTIVGFDYEHCDLLVEMNGLWVSALETYLEERRSEE